MAIKKLTEEQILEKKEKQRLETNKRSREWYQKNKEKEHRRRREYYIKNKEKCAVKSKEWAKNNQDKVKRSNEKYSNSEKRKVYLKKYLKEHKEKQRINSRRCYLNNKENIKNRHKVYYRKNQPLIVANAKAKRKNDPSYRLLLNLRRRLHQVLFGANKSENTLRLIGCTLEELKLHIESQFIKGMNWKTYGVKGWHLDHKIPCSSFDLSDPEQQKACFNFSNLQPLFAFDNLSKGSKLNWSKT